MCFFFNFFIILSLVFLASYLRNYYLIYSNEDLHIYFLLNILQFQPSHSGLLSIVCVCMCVCVCGMRQLFNFSLLTVNIQFLDMWILNTICWKNFAFSSGLSQCPCRKSGDYTCKGLFPGLSVLFHESLSMTIHSLKTKAHRSPGILEADAFYGFWLGEQNPRKFL